MRASTRATHVFAAVVLACLSAGCEENLPSGRGNDAPFAIYGVLSPDLDTQSVRVYPVEAKPGDELFERGDLEVSSTHLATGERVNWSDSIITTAIGGRQVLFWAPFRAEHGVEYRIDVVRARDGETSFAKVRVPPNITVHVDESRAPLIDVIVEGNRIRMLRPEAVYDVHKGPPLLRFEVSYESYERAVDEGWEVTLNMIVDAYEVNYLYNGLAPSLGGVCPFIYLRSLSLRATIGDEAWSPPGGVFDPNILSQTGALSNVENGFGFVGAGYEILAPLDLSRESIESACFLYDE